jgi:hypothetical protein
LALLGDSSGLSLAELRDISFWLAPLAPARGAITQFPILDIRLVCRISIRQCDQSKTPSGCVVRRGSVLSASVRYKEPCHEEGIRLPCKSIAVCSDPDSGTPKKSPALLAGPKETAMARGVSEGGSLPRPLFPIRVAGIGSGAAQRSPKSTLRRSEFWILDWLIELKISSATKSPHHQPIAVTLRLHHRFHPQRDHHHRGDIIYIPPSSSRRFPANVSGGFLGGEEGAGSICRLPRAPCAGSAPRNVMILWAA